MGICINEIRKYDMENVNEFDVRFDELIGDIEAISVTKGPINEALEKNISVNVILEDKTFETWHKYIRPFEIDEELDRK